MKNNIMDGVFDMIDNVVKRIEELDKKAKEIESNKIRTISQIENAQLALDKIKEELIVIGIKEEDLNSAIVNLKQEIENDLHEFEKSFSEDPQKEAFIEVVAENATPVKGVSTLDLDAILNTL